MPLESVVFAAFVLIAPLLTAFVWHRATRPREFWRRGGVQRKLRDDISALRLDIEERVDAFERKSEERDARILELLDEDDRRLKGIEGQLGLHDALWEQSREAVNELEARIATIRASLATAVEEPGLWSSSGEPAEDEYAAPVAKAGAFSGREARTR